MGNNVTYAQARLNLGYVGLGVRSRVVANLTVIQHYLMLHHARYENTNTEKGT